MGEKKNRVKKSALLAHSLGRPPNTLKAKYEAHKENSLSVAAGGREAAIKGSKGRMEERRRTAFIILDKSTPFLKMKFKSAYLNFDRMRGGLLFGITGSELGI